MANKNLNAAKAAKKDEFYTQLTDIERELQHYWPHFRGKTVLCNCDDPYESNFFKYFALCFNQLGLKKLICTCYNGSPVQGNELLLHFEGFDDLSDVRYLLQNDNNVLSLLETGDFRSRECIELLKEADIVVTNPPFSLFREYFNQLIQYDKKFLIIGKQGNAIYKDIFPLIVGNKVWLGYGFKGSAAHFYSPYEDIATANDHRIGMIRVSGVHWFTNLEIPKRSEEIDLVCHYSPEEYPQYDNYNAINVNKTQDIPCDYSGLMGVPITFLDKYCPAQFEIIWQASGNTRASTPNEILEEIGYKPHPEDRGGCGVVNGKRLYSRILIRNKHPKIL